MKRMNCRLFLFLNLVSAVLMGCASQGPYVSDSYPSREIVDIFIDDDPESLILGIRCNQKLAHEAVSQPDPRKIKLLFPATSLNGVRGRFIPPDNEIIGSITARERVANETINSIVYIALKVDATHAVARDENGLRVTFPKIPAPPANTGKIKPPLNHVRKTAKKHPELQLTETFETSAPAATVLQSVTTQNLNNIVTVKVVADGTINNYNTFKLVEPDRIVFDLSKIRSPHFKEQKIAVQSKWIKQIRYFGHPDKLRLVIETHPGNRPKYSSVSTDTGLTIRVGETD